MTMKKFVIASLALLGSAALQAAEVDQFLIKQGEYLSRAGDCVACHTAKNGKPFPDRHELLDQYHPG